LIKINLLLELDDSARCFDRSSGVDRLRLCRSRSRPGGSAPLQNQHWHP
jgi:hypothetical protein